MGNNLPKGGLIPHTTTRKGEESRKVLVEGPASD